MKTVVDYKNYIIKNKGGNYIKFIDKFPRMSNDKSKNV